MTGEGSNHISLRMDSVVWCAQPELNLNGNVPIYPRRRGKIGDSDQLSPSALHKLYLRLASLLELVQQSNAQHWKVAKHVVEYQNYKNLGDLFTSRHCQLRVHMRIDNYSLTVRDQDSIKRFNLPESVRRTVPSIS